MGIDLTKYDINIGTMKRGARNTICDVEGVKVGQVTLKEGGAQTGVTAILPHTGNIYRSKVTAASYVINGFGKSGGLVQVDELGTIETPIILTNVLSVGTASTGLVRYMLRQNPDICLTTGSVNPVVMECNDSGLNMTRELFVKEEHVTRAIEAADTVFDEGAVGAGRGMICFGYKGGIGSASRVMEIDGVCYNVGVLMLTNFGSMDRLRIDGAPVKSNIQNEDKGSVITIIATDLPMDTRQLKRLCKRVPAGLARTGSYYGNGSGDIALAFSTVNRVEHYPKAAVDSALRFSDDYINAPFRAVVEAVEEAVISSLLHAETVTGRDGRVVRSLNEVLK
ncbi:MAG TPA: P1 family peptidase [Eubacteriales bacterium]|nr:P1 family peptidase [Clostridia bacterium]HRV73098.1 P1 family peptidase [Eubacteriales bacterium]